MKKIISFQFKLVADNYKTYKYVGFRFEELGKLVITRRTHRRLIEALVRKLRTPGTSPNYRLALINAFKLRHQVYDYDLSVHYKKRFGSWHY